MKIADHVKARKPMNKIPDTVYRTLLIIALAKIKFIAPVKMDMTSLTGNRIIFIKILIAFFILPSLSRPMARMVFYLAALLLYHT
jgi:hypothetical protein